MHRGGQGQPLQNMAMGGNQGMPFGGGQGMPFGGGYPGQMGQMNPKMGMGYGGNGPQGMMPHMQGMAGNQGMQRGMPYGGDKENGMNSYGLAPSQMGHLNLRGVVNQHPEPGHGQLGMNYPGASNYPGNNPGMRPGLRNQGLPNSPGRFGLNQHGQQLGPNQGRFGQMQPQDHANNLMSSSRLNQNPPLTGRFGGQEIPGLAQNQAETNPSLSPGRYPGVNGMQAQMPGQIPNQTPYTGFSPNRAQPKLDEGLRDNSLMNGGSDPYRQTIPGLRDRFNGTDNFPQNQQAPGLGVHPQTGGALSPRRFNFPGRTPDKQPGLQQKYPNHGLTPQQSFPQPQTQPQSSLSPGRTYGQDQGGIQANPIKIYGGSNENYQNQQGTSLPSQQRPAQTLNDRINPNYAANPFSPHRQAPVQQPIQTDQGRRFGSPQAEDNDFTSVPSNYDPRDAQQTLRDKFGMQEPVQDQSHYNQPRFVRSQPRPVSSQPQTQNLHNPVNTESRVVPSQYQRANGYTNITPKKLTFNGNQVEARYRDFTSIGAITTNETGIAFEFNGAVFQYGADQRSFLERLSNQEYQGRFEQGWDAYVNECSKELDFVDQVLATGGRGQGETITIPKDYASRIII